MPSAFQNDPILAYYIQERPGAVRRLIRERSERLMRLRAHGGPAGIALCQSRGRGFKSRRARHKTKHFGDGRFRLSPKCMSGQLTWRNAERLFP